MGVFLVADWHLGETRLETMGRPFKTTAEMIEVLIERHNSVVAPEDTVIHAGDVCFKDAKDALPYVAKFNGKKTLIRGNHDRGISDEEFSKYFERIVPEGEGIEINAGGVDCWVHHYPTRGRADRFNLVGHVHGSFKCQLNMLNVGVDVHHFYPVSAEKIPFYYRAVCEFYDEDCWAAYWPCNAKFHGLRGKKGSYLDSLKK